MISCFGISFSKLFLGKLVKGMMHLTPHEAVNEDLKKLLEMEGIDVQLSYDGLRIPIML